MSRFFRGIIFTMTYLIEKIRVFYVCVFFFFFFFFWGGGRVSLQIYGFVCIKSVCLDTRSCMCMVTYGWQCRQRVVYLKIRTLRTTFMKSILVNSRSRRPLIAAYPLVIWYTNICTWTCWKYNEITKTLFLQSFGHRSSAQKGEKSEVYISWRILCGRKFAKRVSLLFYYIFYFPIEEPFQPYDENIMVSS